MLQWNVFDINEIKEWGLIMQTFVQNEEKYYLIDAK